MEINLPVTTTLPFRPATEPLVDDIGVVSYSPSEFGLVAAGTSRVLQQWIKRLTDIALSLFLLLVLTPVLIAIAISVRLTSPGPALFRQVRIGWRGQPFTIYKFRTMTTNAEDLLIDLRDRSDVDGPLFKLHLDPRRTRLGAVLRKLSLDELPQLFNVIKGDMSLVGPRPFVPSESAAFTGWAARRFDVRPGMTGRWQVSGRNNLPFDELKRLDHEYVSEWSFWRDLQILLITPARVVRREGAY